MLLLCIKQNEIMEATKKTIEVSEVMTDHLYLLNETDLLIKAEKMLDKFGIRHLPVVSDDKIIGILSQTDIERLSFGDLFLNNTSYGESTILDELTVNDVMRKNPACVYETDSLFDTAKKLSAQEYHAFPVLNKEDNLVGIITTTDLIRFLMDNCSIPVNKL